LLWRQTDFGGTTPKSFAPEPMPKRR
jgi:hypothetical protein